VAVVPRQDPAALADAILAFLETPRRASAETARIVAERFRLPGVAARYLALYREALAR
jgi:glycosyltransferase involved in cell wall biosynthesis